MSEETILTNINTADVSDLIKLPGIGRSMAKRILQNRPYATIEELCRVKGIGSQSLEKFKEQITVGEIVSKKTPDQATHVKNMPNDFLAEDEETPEAEKTLELVESKIEEEQTDQLISGQEPPISEEISIPHELTSSDLSETEEEAEEEIEEEEAKVPAEEHQNLVTRSQARWLAFSSALLALVLTLALTLGILTSINGGLRYAPQNQAVTMERQINKLNDQIDTLSLDIEGFRERIDNLENLSSQMTELEEQLIDTDKEVEELKGQLANNVAEIEALSLGLEELQSSSLRFQTFFEDLQQALNNFFQSEDANDAQ